MYSEPNDERIVGSLLKADGVMFMDNIAVAESTNLYLLQFSPEKRL